MTAITRALGVRGERLAEEHLIEKGIQLLTRNYRIPEAEIDLVMDDEGELVAVEVKTRFVDDLAQPDFRHRLPFAFLSPSLRRR